MHISVKILKVWFKSLSYIKEIKKKKKENTKTPIILKLYHSGSTLFSLNNVTI